MDITKRNKMINLIVLGVLFGLIIIIVPCIVCGVFTPLVNFIKALDTHVTAPTLFGWYHFLCVFLVIGITALLIIFKRNTKESDYRFIVFSGWYIIYGLKF